MEDRQKSSGINLALIIAIGIAVCFLAVFIFTRTSFIESYNFGRPHEIGEAIGGITAPIIGLATTFLLIRTLQLQNDTFKDQQKFDNTVVLKNEVELFFTMFKQLQQDVKNFVYVIEFDFAKFEGSAAINIFADSIAKETDLSNFDSLTHTKNLAYILDSFMSTESQIVYINDPRKRELCNNQLSSFYNFNMRDEIENWSIFLIKVRL